MNRIWALPLRLPDRVWVALPTVLIVLASLVAAVLVGAVIALGSPLMNLLALGVIAGGVLLMIPTRLIVMAVLALGVVAAGLLSYYGGVKQGHWLVYLLCLALWLKLPFDALARSHLRAHRTVQYGPELGLVLPLLGMLVVIVVSSIHNATGPMELFIGARNYVFVWSLTFAVAAGALSDNDLKRVWLLLLVCAAAQAPFVGVQNLIASARGVSWDAMVGTFGGDPEGGGGGSGAMAIYLSIMVGAFVCLLKRGAIGPVWASLGIGSSVLAVLMAETKVFLVIGPLAAGLPLLNELRRRPLFVFSALGLMTLVVAAIFAFYQKTYFEGRSQGVYTVESSHYIDYILSMDTTLDRINRETGEVSRMAVPLIWWQEGWRDGPTVRLFGYGMRESRISRLLGAGKAARRHPFVLTTSSVSALLWDTGLLGLGCFTALLVMLARGSRRLSKKEVIAPFHRACLEATFVGAVVLLVTLLYNDTAMDHYAIQPLLAAMVGYTLYWERRVRELAPHAQAAPAAPLLRPVGD
jgi:hypothetical protein